MTLLYRLLAPLLLFSLVLAGCDSGGGVPDDLGDSTSVGFVESAATLVEGEDETYALEITVDDPGFEEARLNLSVNSSQSTAALGDDATGLTGDTTVAFPRSATSGGTVSIPLTIVDEPIDSTGFLEDTESLVFTLSPADTLAPEIDGGASSFTLTIEEDDEPLTTQEARARSTGSRAVVDGIVTRVDGDGAYVQDSEGALYAFDGDFGAQVGDEVRVDGPTAFFSGLFQLEDVSGGRLTEVLSSGNTLPTPNTISLGEVTDNGEEYESELIRVENFAIDDGGDQQFQAGTNYTITNSSGELVLRIPGGSELEGEDIPERANFQGVLGQFNDFGDPDDNTGYQLLGLESEDLEPVVNLASVDFSDDQLDPMTAYSVASDQDWGTSSEGDPPNAPYAVANGFGADEASNDWLISPALDFTNVENETLRFINAKGFNDSGRRGLQVKVSTDYDGNGNPTNFTWADVSDQVNFSEGDFNFAGSGAVDLSGFQGSEVYVAFQYQSTGPSDAAAWQVDNIVVSGQPAN
ncbi:choice-of-anchor J domain-containing protein [Salinibacter ruber]|uniref:DUF5017 domain-containing protein n=1 Tax=Salinibacter ruber TaxID=146919 RepID=A0A9X2U3Q6_9BACT|nr:choice-of-anchor J domain-containing protein [Salinibacter ruber]MCS3859188.1 hypothetical protein [Salinibacter ruber]MCS3866068.1 hypothetical protein [Salinibacter ruber]MCS4152269.1 hypothetical protein [Salinibacter ruber]